MPDEGDKPRLTHLPITRAPRRVIALNLADSLAEGVWLDYGGAVEVRVALRCPVRAVQHSEVIQRWVERLDELLGNKGCARCMSGNDISIDMVQTAIAGPRLSRGSIEREVNNVVHEFRGERT